MPLILDPLEKALYSLDKCWKRSQDARGDEELRDACIQRFEYTFELSWKMLKRQLEIEIASREEVDSYSKKTLFRVGGEKELSASERMRLEEAFDDSDIPVRVDIVDRYDITEEFRQSIEKECIAVQ